MFFLLLKIRHVPGIYKEGKSGNKAIVITPIKNYYTKFLRSIIIIFLKTHLH